MFDFFYHARFFNKHLNQAEQPPLPVYRSKNDYGLIMRVLKALHLCGEPGKEWINVNCSRVHQFRGTCFVPVHLMPKPGFFTRLVYWLLGKNNGFLYANVAKTVNDFFSK